MKKARYLGRASVSPSLWSKFVSLAVVLMVCERFRAPQWVYGVVGTISAVLLIITTLGWFFMLTERFTVITIEEIDDRLTRLEQRGR